MVGTECVNILGKRNKITKINSVLFERGIRFS